MRAVQRPCVWGCGRPRSAPTADALASWLPGHCSVPTAIRALGPWTPGRGAFTQGSCFPPICCPTSYDPPVRGTRLPWHCHTGRAIPGCASLAPVRSSTPHASLRINTAGQGSAACSSRPVRAAPSLRTTINYHEPHGAAAGVRLERESRTQAQKLPAVLGSKRRLPYLPSTSHPFARCLASANHRQERLSGGAPRALHAMPCHACTVPWWRKNSPSLQNLAHHAALPSIVPLQHHDAYTQAHVASCLVPACPGLYGSSPAHPQRQRRKQHICLLLTGHNQAPCSAPLSPPLSDLELH